MATSMQPEGDQSRAGAKKHKAIALASGLLEHAGTATKKAWEDGAMSRAPKELLAQCDVFYDNDFEYSALPTPTSIRLLEIKRGHLGDLLQCSLHVVDLKDSPSYVALSYSWKKDKSWADIIIKHPAQYALRQAVHSIGIRNSDAGDAARESESFKVVMCDDKRMKVTPNLYDGLLQLRKMASAWYWIDAICIQQRDHAERTRQIQMMGEIFGAAQSVTVWLGGCNQIFSEAVAKLERVTGNFRGAEGVQTPENPKTDIWFTDAQWSVLTGLYLLSRRWFTRLWVVQELCLAKRVMLRFGDHDVRPETIVGLVNALKTSSQKEDDVYDLVRKELVPMVRASWGTYIEFVPSLFQARDHFQQDMKWSLEEWLHLSRGRKATDVGDFVNAGLDLVMDGSLNIDTDLQLDEDDQSQVSDAGPRLWPRLQASSGRGKFEVMLNLAACLLTQSRSVYLLSLAARSWFPIHNHPFWYRGDDALPTWMPSPGTSSRDALEPFAASHKSHQFAACTASLANPKISRDGRKLYLDAIRLSPIKLIAETIDVGIGLFTHHEHMINFLEFAAKVPTPYPRTGECGLDALARTLIADFPIDSEPVIGLVELLSIRFAAHHQRLEEISTKKSNGILGYDPVLESASDPAPDRAGSWNDRLSAAWDALRSIYPDKPWTPLSELLEEANRGLDSLAPDPKSHRETGPKRVSFHDAVAKVTANRTPFLMEDGGLGLAPRWALTGQVPMLVESGYVPYLFDNAEEELNRKLDKLQPEVQDDVQDMMPGTRKTAQLELRARLDEIKRSMGKQGSASVLVGELYIHGIMHGEAMEGPAVFERIAVV